MSIIRRSLKSVLKKLPFKREVFTLLKAIAIPPGRMYRHLYFNGVFPVKTGVTTSFDIMHYGFRIENELFWEGIEHGWECVSLGLWIKLCKNASVIVDIGANTGVYALIAKSVNPRSKVYAYEPVDRVFEKLVKNNELNKYDIQCSPLAISNKNGEAVIYDNATSDHIYSVTVNQNFFPPTTQVIEKRIQTITLDTIIEQEHIQRFDLLKIDVETHEPEVLEGYAKHLKIHRPTMLIEILTDEIGQKIETMLEGLGYLYFNIDETKGIRRVEKIEKSDYYNYLFCSEETALMLGIR